MKNTILMIAMLCAIVSARAEVNPNSWDSLTYWIEQEIKTTQPDLAGRWGRIKVDYKKGESSGLLITNQRDYSTKDVEITSLSSRVPVSLYAELDSVHLKASYKFDEYTGELFFSSWTNAYPINKIFGGHNTLRVEALGGVGTFRKRWAAYIHQLVPVDTTTKYITIGQIRWLSFDLDLDGTIIPNNSIPSDSILSTFLKNEIPWLPSKHNGRIVRVRVSVDLPERISHLYPTHWDSDDHVSPIFEAYAHNLHHKKIFVQDNAMSYRDGVNVISMVNDHGKVAAVRYHHGDLEACKDIEEQIRKSETIKEYSVNNLGALERFYFYTYQK